MECRSGGKLDVIEPCTRMTLIGRINTDFLITSNHQKGKYET